MSVLKNYTLRITVLSPVHMGTDEDYAPTNYVIEGSELHALGMDAVLHLPNDARQELANLVKGNVGQRSLLAIQSLFYRHRALLMSHATHKVAVGNGVAKLYQERIGKVAQHEGGGREVRNKLEIERAFYNPIQQSLVLPGTGLKGAVRTALLNHLNGGKALSSSLQDFHAKDGSGIVRNASRKLQQRLFKYLDDQGKETLSLDPMRLVHLADALSDQGAMRKVLFAVNRRRKLGEHQSQAEQKGLYQLLECAMPGSVFGGELRIMPTPPSDAPKHHFAFRDIAAACQRFYAQKLNQETNALQLRGLLNTGWKQAVSQLFQDEALKKRISEGRAFLLRVGRHSGAESLTLDGVRQIRIMQGSGKKPAWEAAPKTWWLAADQGKDQQNGLMPFGWILIEEGEGLPPLQDDLFANIDKQAASKPLAKRLSPAEIARRKLSKR